MARPGSKAAKKRDPRRSDEWPVDKYPFVIHKRYADPVYRDSISKVKSWLRDDIGRFRNQFKDLGAADVLESCDRLLEQVAQLNDGIEHSAEIAGVIDPLTRLRYEATVTRRDR